MSLHLLYSFIDNPSPSDIYTLSLHDALPISKIGEAFPCGPKGRRQATIAHTAIGSRPDCLWIPTTVPAGTTDRKSTRLNSSHTVISYAVFCLKKKKINMTAYKK